MPAEARDPLQARRSVVVIERFYRNPDAVREHALRQPFYLPYESERAVRAGGQRATWWASRFREADDCPFKSSPTLITSLEQAVGESIDMEHWRGTFPLGRDFKPPRYLAAEPATCLWNCCFHVKPDNGQQLGGGVHNHVTDSWNSVGAQGWAGIIYLTPRAPLEGGLHLWRNKDAERRYDWMTPAENWELIDSLGNVFNRLLLVRGDIPHSGARGWGDRVDNGRMYQTFFFKTIPRKRAWPVGLPQIGA